MRTARHLFMTVIAAALLSLALATAARAQTTTVTANDIQRLQDSVYTASSDIAQLRSRDPQLASTLQSDLDNLRDDVIYLKVKLRREGSVPFSEYSDVRDRLQSLRSRAEGVPAGTTGTRPSARSTNPSAGTTGAEVPAGTQLDVRLEDHLNSGTNHPEDRFRATTVADLLIGNRVVIPAGSSVRGTVVSVDPATRTDRKGSMRVAFDEITIEGRTYPIRGSVTQPLESQGISGETGKIGAGAAVGGIIGGIIGGVKGALAGILIGGGGTMIATPGTNVDLPVGTVLRVRFDQALTILAR